MLLSLALLFVSSNGQTLKAATAAGWGGYVGTEMNVNNMDNDADYKAKAAEQYNMVVAEYECKFGSTQWAQGQWNWVPCDKLYDFANTNSMAFRFHALIWYIHK